MKDPLLYDSISSTYTFVRREDARVAAHIRHALGDAARVLNVGAGTGNYEPGDRLVVGVDPSRSMLARRSRAGSVRAVAERLPFPNRAFDAAMATLTLHHWLDLRAGLQEMARVAARQVIFMFDAVITNSFWAVDYFSEALTLPSEVDAPDVSRVAEVLDVVHVRPIAIPIDCTDGFGAAFWGRPEMYLQESVQQGMSWLAQLPPETRATGTARLRDDLLSGAWDERHGHLRQMRELDVGYRLIIAGS